ncbi:hypothetical protein QFC21_006399 [Naganishia friedmannii]|uniref:Uncharacterized protein n=1 Tax=Naganishia friedmannii TaxID=89922 RepID=A0ACC2V392_9TREE|nr:hypothetical protein QFC21_006399 [Naganishia friedmannii]
MPSQHRASQRATQRRIVSPPSAGEGEIDELAGSSSSGSSSSSSGDELDSDEEDEQEWEAIAILDERTIPDPSRTPARSKRAASSTSSRLKPVPRITQYLIDWEGVDPKTGKRWPPSWEDAEGATEGLVEEWKERKLADPGLVGRYIKLQEEKKKEAKAEKGKTAAKQSSSSAKKYTPARTTPAKRRELAINPSITTTNVAPLPPATAASEATSTTTGKRKRSPRGKSPAPTSPLATTAASANTNANASPSQTGSERRRIKKQKTSGTPPKETIGRTPTKTSSRISKRAPQNSTVSAELPARAAETSRTSAPTGSSTGERASTGSRPTRTNRPTQQQQPEQQRRQTTQPTRQLQSPTSVVEDSQPPLPVTSSDERSVLGATPASGSASGSFAAPHTIAATINPTGSPSARLSKTAAGLADTSTGGAKGAAAAGGTSYISSPLNRSTTSKGPASSLPRSAQTAARQTSSTTAAPSVHFDTRQPLREVLSDPSRAKDGAEPAQAEEGKHKHESETAGLDISASQADALSRALDLLMEEEAFLDTAEAEAQAMYPHNLSHFGGNAVAGPSNTSHNDNIDAQEVEGVQARLMSGMAVASSTEDTGKPPSGKERSKQHYPIPQMTPSAFRQFEQHGASSSLNDTQPDSIAEFDDSMVHPSHPHTQPGPLQPTTTTTIQAETRITEIIPPAEELRGEEGEAAVQAVVVEAFVEVEMEVEDDSESFVPVLGEENWSRILDSSTIDPAMLGKPPGVMDEGNTSSSDDDSHRSGSHVATRQPQVQEQYDFVTDAARISALEYELAREREEKRQLDDGKRQLEEAKRQLENDLKAMTREHSSTQEQYSLMQDLYTRASETTMRLNRENEELREENGKMSEQLSVGLEQKDLFYKAIIAAKDHELSETTTQRDLLLEQASRTGDAIREKAGRLPLVEAERNDALARIAACPLCSKAATQSDEDSDYNPTQDNPVVPDATRPLRTRRHQVAAEPHSVPEVPERKLHDGESRLHASPGEWEERRKQYPINSLERWKRPPNLLFPPVKPAMEKKFDLDIDTVGMVYMCRWRPAHGNACGALFANRENLAEHAIEHFSDENK